MITPLIQMPIIPIGPNHPGAFGVNRHLHVHTGVDLYTAAGSPVRAIEKGSIISIAWFTGPSINMPWWNDTRAVYIEGATGVFNYGEIQELPGLEIGDTVEEGQFIGSVLTVLKKFKGRPMSMLHLELYDHGYTDTWGEWVIGEPKPEHLQDPTPQFWRMIPTRSILQDREDPYAESAQYFKERLPRDLHLGMLVYHKDVYEGCEQMRVVGLRDKEVELEGDYSGGTHAVCQRNWESRDGVQNKRG